jgi:outer membrane lipoprotein-sorting protein
MRILPLIVLAAATFADPWLPRVAQNFKRLPGARIPLEWIVTPAGGFAPPRTTKGILKISTGNRFRFDSDGLVAACDGTTLWQWNASTNQVLIHEAAKVDPAGLPAGMLEAALVGSETSATAAKEGKRSLEKLALDNSRPPLSKFAGAWMWIDPADLRPVRIEVEDRQGTRTTWNLLKITAWKAGPKDFVFAPPTGADVVDLRK